MNFIEKNIALVLLLALFILDSIEIVDARGLDYLIVFLIGVVLNAVLVRSAESVADRIMILTLSNALTQKGTLTKIDIFNEQNDLTGHTFDGDFQKMKRVLMNQSIYLHDYIHEPNLQKLENEIKQHNVTVFDSFRGFSDRLKMDHYHKIEESEDRDIESIKK